MTTPSSRLSGAPFSNAGPNQTMLQKLLEEINGTQPTAVSPITDSTHVAPRSHSDSVTRPASMWVASSAVAQDARDKLRALDEARQRKRSINSSDDAPDNQILVQLRLSSTETGVQRMATRANVWKAPTSPSVFAGVDFSNPRTSSVSSTPSPGSSEPANNYRECVSINSKSEFLTNSIAGMVAHTPPVSPALASTKRIKVELSETESNRQEQSRSESTFSLTSRDASSMSSRDSAFIERRPPTIPTSFDLSRLASISSFRQTASMSQGHLPPSTPTRNDSNSSRNSSAGSPTMPTPTWVKPFHLVDEEKSIYMKKHGDDWRDNPLCLYCFRQHQSFNRILQYGCEVCGREDALESHYWEVNERV